MSSNKYYHEHLAGTYGGFENLKNMQKVIMQGEYYYHKTNVTAFATGRNVIHINDYAHMPDHKLTSQRSTYIHEREFMLHLNEKIMTKISEVQGQRLSDKKTEMLVKKIKDNSEPSASRKKQQFYDYLSSRRVGREKNRHPKNKDKRQRVNPGREYLNVCNLKAGKFIKFKKSFACCKPMCDWCTQKDEGGDLTLFEQKCSCDSCEFCGKCEDCIGRCYSDVRLIPRPLFEVLTGLSEDDINTMIDEPDLVKRQLISRQLNGVYYLNYTLDSKAVSDDCITVNINGIPHHTKDQLKVLGYDLKDYTDSKDIFGYMFYRYVNPEGDFVSQYTLSSMTRYPFDILTFFKTKGLVVSKKFYLKDKSLRLYNTKLKDHPLINAGFQTKQYYIDSGMSVITFNKYNNRFRLKKDFFDDNVYSLKKAIVPVTSYNKEMFMRRYGLTKREFYRFRIQGRIIYKHGIDYHPDVERKYILVSKETARPSRTVLDVYEYTEFYDISIKTFLRWKSTGTASINNSDPSNTTVNIQLVDHESRITVYEEDPFDPKPEPERFATNYYTLDYFIKLHDINRKSVNKFTSLSECKVYTKNFEKNGKVVRVNYYSKVNLNKDTVKNLYTRECIKQMYSITNLSFYPMLDDKKIVQISRGGYYLYCFPDP
jgi:hypothetical protein